MRSTLARWLWHTASVWLLLAVSTLSTAVATECEKHADGFAVYMGVMPAQVLRGNADASDLATMHGGLPAGRGSHHLVIAIYDERTQRQVEGADVVADVTSLGLGPTRRKLEPMPIGTSATFGNFFPMSGSGSYTIQVTIHVPGRGVRRKSSSITPIPARCRICTRSRLCLLKRDTTKALGARA